MKKLILLAALISLCCALVFGNGGQQEGSKQAGDKPVTLTVLDEFIDNEGRDAAEQVTKMFEQANPGIKVTRVPKTSEVVKNTLKPAFMAGEAQDVLYTEVGIGWVGPFIKAGYIADLTDTWKTLGWTDKLIEASRTIPSVKGMIYGVGHEIESMGCYYNKTKFDQLGLKVPTTVAELNDVMQKIKNAGYIPLSDFLDNAWYHNMNFVGTVLYGFMSKEEIAACMNNDGPWDIPSVRNAITAIEDWIAKGYFPKNLEAGGDGMEDLFYNEQALILITGNWSVKDIERVVGNKFEVGIFPFPSGTQGMKASAVNFAGSGYMVNNQGKNREAAIKYIDFVMAKPETAKVWYEVGRTIPPFKGDIPGLQLGRLNQIVRAGLNDLNIQNLAGINMWLPPTAFDFFSTAGQRIAIKRLNRDTFIEELNKVYAADKANKATRSTF